MDKKRAKKYTAICIVALAAAFFMPGCMDLPNLAQPPLRTEYYLIEYPPPPVSDKTIPKTVKVRLFSATPPYDSTRIIYKKKEFNTDQYTYHRWHATPAQMASSLIFRDMRESKIFAAVFGPSCLEPGDWIIEGNVERFLENDTTDPWTAEVAILITIRNTRDANPGKVIQKNYTASVPCEKNNPRALARAMSLAMQRISQEMLKDVAKAIGD